MMPVAQHQQILSLVLAHQQAALKKQAHERDILKDMLKQERSTHQEERQKWQVERQAMRDE